MKCEHQRKRERETVHKLLNSVNIKKTWRQPRTSMKIPRPLWVETSASSLFSSTSPQITPATPSTNPSD